MFILMLSGTLTLLVSFFFLASLEPPLPEHPSLDGDRLELQLEPDGLHAAASFDGDRLELQLDPLQPASFDGDLLELQLDPLLHPSFDGDLLELQLDVLQPDLQPASLQGVLQPDDCPAPVPGAGDRRSRDADRLQQLYSPLGLTISDKKGNSCRKF